MRRYYLDASASAYQIMAVINQDKNLCVLTNVIKDGSENMPEKKDIYTYFLGLLNSTIWSDPEFLSLKKLTNEQKLYLQKNFDRKLTKAIVMPLIYGKTGVGFADDLKAMYYKAHIYPNPSDLLKLANLIIKILKNHASLAKINLFMQTMRTIAHMLHDSGDLTIVGPFSHCNICYHKEIQERIRIYGRSKTGITYKQVSLTTLAVDDHNRPIKSRSKAVNSFVANYIHYLDALVCQHVIKRFATEHNFQLATVHDCFFVPPEKTSAVNKFYREGLVLASVVHQYNLIIWLKVIISNLDCSNSDFDKSELLSMLSEEIEATHFDMDHERYNWAYTAMFRNDSFWVQLEAFKNGLNEKKRAQLTLIMQYLEMYQDGGAITVATEILEKPIMSLFTE